ncbi:MAG: SMP-30/gluconolactonase/LRE family protein [Thermoanaerobaculia bacterium]
MLKKTLLISAAALLALSFLAPLTAQDAPSLQQLEQMLTASPDHGGVWLELAAAHARAGNKSEAARWLEKAIARGLDFDLNDPTFAVLRESPELKPLLARAEANRRVVSRSKAAFRIPEKDLIPEGIAHDPKTGAFFLGSLHKSKIVRIDKAGKVSDFTTSGQDGLWEVLGMKVDPATRTLWVCSAAGAAAGEADGSAGLFRYDVDTGKLRGKHVLPGKPQPHLFNDLAFGAGGEVFLTDSKAGTLYRLKPGQDQLEVFVGPGTLIYPNGVAISTDHKKLFVADFAKNLSIVDVATGQARPLPHPERVNVAGIDGLYLYGNTLIAVQNSAGVERIVRFRLNAALDAIEAEEILESRNPLFKIPTTGVVAGDSFFYIANSQLRSLGEQGRLRPEVKLEEVVILTVSLGR